MQPVFELAGYPVFHEAVADSTQTLARIILRHRPDIDQAVFWADEQRAGKGRTLGEEVRHWHSPPGNLYITVMKRLNVPPAILARLPLIAAHACLDVLLPSGRDFTFKWPNDLLLEGRKCGGLLVEAMPEGALIGIGLNLASFPADTPYPATSLAEAGLEVTPKDTLCALIPALHEAISSGVTGSGWEAMLASLRARQALLGERVSVWTLRERVEGVCEGLEDDGALRLRMEDGAVRSIYSGEVSDAPGH